MKTKSSAFTLIELLIVITIIAILASIALPAFTTVQERANQTKDLSNGKQIGLALKQFAIDNNGSYPAKAPAADYSTAADLTSGGTSNDAFWWLFPTYLTSEDIFVVAGSKWTPAPPDNTLDPAGSAGRTNTLKVGENSYAYVAGLTDTANSALPLVADGFGTTTPLTYDTSKAQKGGVWAARKAIVILCDASGQIMKCDLTDHTVHRPGHATNMFSPGIASDPWLDAGGANFVLNPN